MTELKSFPAIPCYSIKHTPLDGNRKQSIDIGFARFNARDLQCKRLWGRLAQFYAPQVEPSLALWAVSLFDPIAGVNSFGRAAWSASRINALESSARSLRYEGCVHYLKRPTADTQFPSVKQPIMPADEARVGQEVVKMDNPRVSWRLRLGLNVTFALDSRSMASI